MELEHFNEADKSRMLNIVGFVIDESPRLPYHNCLHHLDVHSAARQNGLSSGLGYNDQLALEIAALGHDLIHESMRADNEERSFEKIRPLLNRLALPSYVVSTAGRLIIATKMPVNPKDLLEGIICDADTENVGREDFFEKGEKLRKEYALHGRTFTDRGWAAYSLKFLSQHRFYTPFARRLREDCKSKNIEKLTSLLSTPPSEQP